MKGKEKQENTRGPRFVAVIPRALAGHTLPTIDPTSREAPRVGSEFPIRRGGRREKWGKQRKSQSVRQTGKFPRKDGRAASSDLRFDVRISSALSLHVTFKGRKNQFTFSFPAEANVAYKESCRRDECAMCIRCFSAKNISQRKTSTDEERKKKIQPTGPVKCVSCSLP